MASKKKRTETRSIRKKHVYIFLTALTILLYVNTVSHDFTLDDAIVITENVFTKEGISGLKNIFTHDTFYGFFQQEGKANLVSGGRYRPLSQAMFALEYSSFGQNPLAGHIGNIILFVLTVLSIFYITHYFAKSHLSPSVRIIFAGIVALIFATHPLHTEAVANIKGRDEILVLLFGLWCVYFSSRYYFRKELKYGIVSGFFFLSAILSKENAVAFLAVIPLAIYFFKKGRPRKIVRAIVPSVAAFLLYMVLRISVLGYAFGGDAPLELMNNPFVKFVDGQYIYMNLGEKIPLVILGLLKNIQLLVFPHPLTHDYYPKYFDITNFSNPKVLLGLFTYLGLLFLVIKFGIRKKVISFSILFFLTTLFLTTNILFPIGTHLSERFLFTPSYSIALLGGSFFLWLKRKYGPRTAWVTICGISFLFSIKTVIRNKAWKDNYTLFTTDVITSSRSAKVQNAAGGEIIAQSYALTDSLQKSQAMRRALSHLDRAIEIHPTYRNAFLLSGNAHYYIQEYDEAIKKYNSALDLSPGYQEALDNRALAYRDLGRHLGEKQGDLQGAISSLKKALEYLPDDYETNRLLGIAYGNSRDTQRSIAHFLKALESKPDDSWTNYNLGIAYLAIQDTTSGMRYIARAKELNPQVGN